MATARRKHPVTKGPDHQAIKIPGLDELLRGLEQVSQDAPAEGFTTTEFAEALGVTPGIARSRLRQAIKAGLAKYNGRALRRGINEVMQPLPVYVLVGKKS